ncbi:DUF1120 domain-containing protein [Pseudomonas sp. SWRI12]|uniref:DUF1120 domain-containing protein n=1 Tax=Pseudomonas zanjanensis TaxID=2745496 RepID=A0A923FEB7_9PSED|nr:DUF1120 domain-containing protein [Pseudomonas zanjanensis]MBV4498473.1 DUF1120 domain-containing protein [Pseudomonas zanjanensis]
MKKIFGLAAVSVLALACANVQAADLQVTGSIVPGSCSLNIPTLAVDFGRITPTELSPIDYTRLGARNTAFNITCDGPTLVGLTASDNRAASRKHEAMEIVDLELAAPLNSFGLGTNANGDKIGAYALFIRNSSMDGGTSSRTILSGNDGASWFGAKDFMRSLPQYTLSWAATGDTGPYMLTTLSGELEIEAVINNTTELAVRDDVQIDGSATLELKYI